MESNAYRKTKSAVTDPFALMNLIDPLKFNIDMKALAIAQQLMLANTTQHRQSHAASTAALFNLVMGSSVKAIVKEKEAPNNKQHEQVYSNKKKHEHPLEMLVGHWEACDGNRFRVFRSDIGMLAQDKSCGSLTLFRDDQGAWLFNHWKMMTNSPDKVQWRQTRGDVVLDNGTTKHQDELRELTWTRSESMP